MERRSRGRTQQDSVTVGKRGQRERTTLTLAELQNAPQLIISKCVKSHAAHVVVYEN